MTRGVRPKTGSQPAVQEKETSVTTPLTREAELLREMAKAATLTEQRRLAAELADLRAKRTAEEASARQLDLSPAVAISRYP